MVPSWEIPQQEPGRLGRRPGGMKQRTVGPMSTTPAHRPPWNQQTVAAIGAVLLRHDIPTEGIDVDALGTSIRISGFPQLSRYPFKMLHELATTLVTQDIVVDPKGILIRQAPL